MSAPSMAHRDAWSIDALTHVTPDGRWFGTSRDASEANLLRDLDAAGIECAVVVTIAEQVSNEFVIGLSARHGSRLLPVGGFNPVAWPSTTQVALEARAQLRDAGFLGVKLHPRLHRYDPLDPRVFALLEEMSGWAAPPALWLCTMFHHQGGSLRKGPVESIYELVNTFPRLRFVLAHGGGPDLLRLSTAVRHCPNAVLDISSTLVRFAGSTVETDVRYLLSTFDRRLVFGSDFPEISVTEARTVLDRVGSSAKPGAVARVLGQNLADFLDLDPQAGSGSAIDGRPR